MRNEQAKGDIERSVFMEFVEKSRLPVDHSSITKCCGQQEPDILCTILGEGNVAFELVEICAQDLAEKIAHFRSGGIFEGGSFENPTKRIINSKLGKSYRTNYKVELLCYTNGRVIAPDSEILSELRDALSSAPSNKFHRVWLLGEHGEVHQVCY